MRPTSTPRVYGVDSTANNADVLLPHLAEILRQTRIDAGLSLRDMEAPTGLERGSVHRFETHKSGWPRNPDEMVNAYALAAGQSPVELWDAAVRRWGNAEPVAVSRMRDAVRGQVAREASPPGARPPQRSKSGPGARPKR